MSSRRLARLVDIVAARSERWRSILRLLPRAGAGLAAAAVILNVLLGLLPLGFIVWTSATLAELPAAAREDGPVPAWLTLAAVAAPAITAFCVQQVLAPFQTALGELVTRRVDGDTMRRLMTASLTDAPMALLERREVMDLLSDARAAFDRATPTPGAAIAGALALVARYTQLLGAVALVGVVLHPLVGLVVAVTALTIRAGQRGSLARFATLWDGMAGSRRKINYLLDVGLGTAAAKEIRVLGLLPWLQRRHRDDSRAYLLPMWADRRRIFFRPFLVYAAVALAGGGLALAALARAAASGQLTLLELSIAIQAILVPMRFGVFFPESDVKTQHGLQTYHALTAFERRTAADRMAPPAPEHVVSPPNRIADGLPRTGIRFERVVFAYREEAPAVLDGLDLELPAGRSTAVVGLNGAGKTTLIKLLARLYDPTAGRVLVDGHDLRALDARAWQRRLAVIFQDYVRYELSAADNIGLGAPSLMRQRDALLDAAERAGAGDLLRRLPNGLDTPLSQQYRGGQDLSGGQWQRVALARALFAVRAGATVLVLDEPTAQLDVRAEVEFFDQFLALTRGLTTVLVSHRFSTVRRADHIAVLEHGRVAEQGSHQELIDLDGRYANLFRLQAERFADGAVGGRSA